jgi:hypothetical protein
LKPSMNANRPLSSTNHIKSMKTVYVYSNFEVHYDNLGANDTHATSC